MEKTNLELANGSYKQGKAYQKAANILIKLHLTLLEKNDLKNFDLLIPSITCSAFSCELLLKSILYKNNICSKEHNLSDLFEKIPKNIQSEIIKIYNIKKENFTKGITKIGNSFVKFRYISEEYGFAIDLQFLFKLNNILIDYINA